MLCDLCFYIIFVGRMLVRKQLLDFLFEVVIFHVQFDKTDFCWLLPERRGLEIFRLEINDELLRARILFDTICFRCIGTMDKEPKEGEHRCDRSDQVKKN
jgi:hypothetical protein